MMLMCPCSKCITRAMCLNKEYYVVLQCPFVREYLNIDKDGNPNIPKLRIWCMTLNFKLRVHRPVHSSGTSAYYIDLRKDKSGDANPITVR